MLHSLRRRWDYHTGSIFNERIQIPLNLYKMLHDGTVDACSHFWQQWFVLFKAYSAPIEWHFQGSGVSA